MIVIYRFHEIRARQVKPKFVKVRVFNASNVCVRAFRAYGVRSGLNTAINWIDDSLERKAPDRMR